MTSLERFDNRHAKSQDSGFHLITSADENTWKYDRPVLFLGDWCRLFDRRHIWQNMNASLASPYGLSESQRAHDHQEARTLEEKLFPEFYTILNQYHTVNYDSRSWEILIRHWFRRTINVLLNRTRSLQLCLQNYSINSVTLYPEHTYPLSSPDSLSAIWSFSDDLWNQELYGAIIRFISPANTRIETLSKISTASPLLISKTENHSSHGSLSQILRNRLLHRLSSASSKLGRDDDALIINSYLPRLELIKLHIFCRQWPQNRKTPSLSIAQQASVPLRRALSEKLKNKSRFDCGLESVARHLLFRLLPVCYLEGFSQLQKIVLELPWPTNPKFIFTSNSFDTDEIFKLWTVQKMSLGAKYFVGQHGNCYGTHRYMYPTIEECTADNFITWGWSESSANHKYLPAFILKKRSSSKQLYNPKGNLLLVQYPFSRRINTWDSDEEYLRYFQDQQKLVSSLTQEQRAQTIIRLHSTYSRSYFNEKARWEEYDPTLQLDTSKKKIDKLIKTSRLVVHSYDSTGMLETLSANIPTLAFWQGNLQHLRATAVPLYQMLINVGIIHLSPESASEMINNIWSDVEAWWFKKSIQDARAMFCDKYARLSSKPAKDLAKLLNNN